MRTIAAEAARIHRETITVEGHRDVYELLYLRARGHTAPLRTVTLPRLRRGGVDVVVYAVCGDTVDHAGGTDDPVKAALENLDAFYVEAEQADAGVAVILTAEDVPEQPDGRVHFLLSFEGGKPIRGSVAALRSFYRLGIRSMQITHNLRNELGDGMDERGTNGGLTRAGVSVVKEMNRLGMLVDVSHLSPATFFDVLRVTEQPVVASHSNCCAVFEHPRGLTDEQLRAMRDNGGLVGVNLIAHLVDPARPTIDRVVDHLDHAAELLGIEHVYIGADFTKSDGPRSLREQRPMPLQRVNSAGTVEEVHLEHLSEADELPHLTERLLERGFSANDVALILGGNFTRFLRQTLRPAADQRVSPAEP